LLHLEELGVAGRGLGGRANHPFRLGSPALDSLWVHDGRDGGALVATAAASPGRTSEAKSGHLLRMSTLQLGGLYALATFGVLFFGVPIAFALGGVATVFMLAFMPLASLDTVAQN